MDVFGFGKRVMMTIRNNTLQVRLANLIAATRTAPPKLDIGVSHFLHETLN